MRSTSVLPVQHPQGEYAIHIGADLLAQLRQLANLDKRPYIIVTDDIVGALYAGQFADALGVITIPAGEQHKNLETLQMIYGELLALGADRGTTLVALGGGVVGDITGFAAASYMRGVDFVQCPTTLLAMVDASVGGKTGVDLPQGKNLVGAFKQPTAVLADVTTLTTLPAAQFAAGMAEVIKHGLIDDPALFAKLEQDDWALRKHASWSPESLQSLVHQAVQVKYRLVQEDPFEHGRRALLNLGHTFGHAIEQVTQYGVLHGDGVAMGLVAAANLSERLGFCAPGLQARLEKVLAYYRLPTRIPSGLDAQALYTVMGRDKKKAAGRVRFILLRDVGQAFITAEVPQTAVLASITAVQQPAE